MCILTEMFSGGGNSISFNNMHVHKRAHLSTVGFYPLKKNELKAPELVRKYAYKNTARIKTLRNNIKKMPHSPSATRKAVCAPLAPTNLQSLATPSFFLSPPTGSSNLE